jgi:hypothetical protein
MKLKAFILFFLLSFSVFTYCQKNDGVNFLFNISRSAALGSPSNSFQYPDPTYALGGIDMKLLFNTKINHVSFMTGSTLLIGGNEPHGSATYGGGCYFGPYLSVGNKWIRPWAYVGLGLFSFHDDILEGDGFGGIKDYQQSNFTSFGTKSALGFSIVVKSLSLNLGYQFFATAADKAAIVQHGYEAGIGIRF